MCLALQPYGSNTEIVWWDYRRTEDIDTLLSGSSNVAYGVKPQSIDAVLGSHSFSLSTPSQSLRNTLAAIKTASAEHDLDRVIVGVGYETMASKPYIGAAAFFMQVKSIGEPLPSVMQNVANLLTDDAFFGNQHSFFALFPWTYSHVDITPQSIADNIYNRTHYNTLEAGMRYVKAIDPCWDYAGQGYYGYDGGIGQGVVHDMTLANNVGDSFDEDNLAALQEICSHCAQNDIPLYVFGVRYTPSATLEYGEDYGKNMAQVRDLVEGSGANFFDLNMIHRDVFDIPITSYKDFTHLNVTGAEETSTQIARLIQQIEAGEDIQNQFYDYSRAGWKDYCASIDYVDSVDFTYSLDEDGNISIDAAARTGSTTTAVYRLEVLDADSQEWRTIRDYDEDPHFVLSRDDLATADIRVIACAQGDEQNPERIRWSEGIITL